MQDTYYQATDQIIYITKEIYYGITQIRKKYHHYVFLKITDVT